MDTERKQILYIQHFEAQGNFSSTATAMTPQRAGVAS